MKSGHRDGAERPRGTSRLQVFLRIHPRCRVNLQGSHASSRSRQAENGSHFVAYSHLPVVKVNGRRVSQIRPTLILRLVLASNRI